MAEEEPDSDSSGEGRGAERGPRGRGDRGTRGRTGHEQGRLPTGQPGRAPGPDRGDADRRLRDRLPGLSIPSLSVPALSVGAGLAYGLLLGGLGYLLGYLLLIADLYEETGSLVTGDGFVFAPTTELLLGIPVWKFVGVAFLGGHNVRIEAEGAVDTVPLLFGGFLGGLPGAIPGLLTSGVYFALPVTLLLGAGYTFVRLAHHNPDGIPVARSIVSVLLYGVAYTVSAAVAVGIGLVGVEALSDGRDPRLITLLVVALGTGAFYLVAAALRYRAGPDERPESERGDSPSLLAAVVQVIPMALGYAAVLLALGVVTTVETSSLELSLLTGDILRWGIGSVLGCSLAGAFLGYIELLGGSGEPDVAEESDPTAD